MIDEKGPFAEVLYEICNFTLNSICNYQIYGIYQLCKDKNHIARTVDE